MSRKLHSTPSAINPSVSSKNINLSRRGTAKGPLSIESGTRRGSETDTQAQPQYVLGTMPSLSGETSPASQCQNKSPSVSACKTIRPRLSGVKTDTSLPCTVTLPDKATVQPNQDPRHTICIPADSSVENSDKASSWSIDRILDTPWIQVLLNKVCEHADRAVWRTDRRRLASLQQKISHKPKDFS